MNLWIVWTFISVRKIYKTKLLYEDAHASSLHMKGEEAVVKEQRLRYFPIGLFASVMGFGGVTLAVRQGEELYGWNHLFSTILLSITTLMFILNAAVLIYRLIRYRGDVIQDFNHPVKMNFFGAISISLLLLAVALLAFSKDLSFVVWIIGAVLQIGLTLLILSRVIWHHTFEIAQFNPAWFIPIVGNIIVPIAGSVHVSMSINWMFFSIGALFSIIYMTIFMSRIFFHPSLPRMLLPMFYILMAPPAIGFVSYMRIVETPDSFAYMLYGTAFFVGLLLVSQVKRFFTAPFSIAWWAFLFPSAAMTLATIHLYHANGEVFYQWLFNIQLVGLLALAVYLAIRTIQLAVQKKLCVKE